MLRVFALAMILFLPAPVAADEVYDPLEPFNRAVFWINDKLDIVLFEPLAKVYEKILPDEVEEAVGNFFQNLDYPSALLSDVVQFKFDQALDHTARFAINTTLGIGGLFDVAEHYGFEHHHEDFGVALAYRGVGAGPYLVLPILGASNFRDAVGLAVDGLINPVSVLGYSSNSGAQTASLALYGLRFVNTRADLLEAVDAAKESALDYYLFVREAYAQYREGVITDGEIPEDNLFDDDQGVEGDEEEGEDNSSAEKAGENNLR